MGFNAPYSPLQYLLLRMLVQKGLKAQGAAGGPPGIGGGNAGGIGIGKPVGLARPLAAAKPVAPPPMQQRVPPPMPSFRPRGSV